LSNDSSNYVKEHPVCISQKTGISIKPITTPIIPKGTREGYVGDDWKPHKEFSTLSDYTWVIVIIDHFSKFMISYIVKTNDAINTLLSIKEFCLLKGMQTIL